MAQLHQKYDFYPSQNKVEIHGTWPLARIMVIANATTNELIYNFAASNIGVVSHEIDHEREVTVMVLNKDCSTMSADDTLQIMLALDFQYMKPEEALMDPVHKMRVSTPENLIDTDFEYGLQPTKWETLETLNNVPSFFISEGDTPITSINSIRSLENSNIITVICNEPHGLSVGTPIDVQGLTSRTAEGKFLISSVSDTEFVYKCSGPQRLTGEIGSIYTTITPGTFFTGSEIGFNPTTGLSTDAAAESLITLTTNTPHGFQQGNQFYLVNTLGTKQLTVDVANTDVVADDGRRIVDPDNFISETSLGNSSLTETKAMRARHYTKFDASAVNIDDDSITWSEHGLRDNDCVLYAPPSGNQEIGGLQRYKVYWVQVVDTNRIRLRATYNGSARNLTSAGEYTKGRAGLHLVYEIYRTYIYYNQTYSNLWTRYNQTGTGSGWDTYSTYNGARGLGSGTNIKYMLIEQVNGGTSYSWYATSYPNGVPNSSYGPPAWSEYNYDGYGTYREWTSGENFGSDGNEPGVFNPIEDFSKFENFYYTQNYSYAGYFRFYKYRYIGNYNEYPSNNGWGWFIIPLVEDEEADSVFVENHGLSSGDSVTIDYITENGYGEEEFTTPGTATFTVPDGVTSISVVAVGGGGGGNQYNSYSSGGAGGGLGYKNNITVTPGEQIPLYIGNGGQQGSYTSGYNSNSFGQHSVFNTSGQPITDLAGNYNNWDFSRQNYGRGEIGNPNSNHIGRGVSTIELSRTGFTNRPTDDGSSLAFFFKDAYEGQPFQYTDWANALRLYNVPVSSNSDFTMECWVWIPNYYGSYAHVMGWEQQYGTIWIRNNGSVYFRSGAGGVTNTQGGLINTSSWHHVAVTRQSGTIRIFVDGVERASTNYTGQVGQSSRYFTLGKDTRAGTSYNPQNMYIYRPHWASGAGSCKYAAGFTPLSNYGTTTGSRFLLTVDPNDKFVAGWGGQAGARMTSSSSYYNLVGGGSWGLGGGKGGSVGWAGSFASGGGGASGYTGFGGRSGTTTYQAGSQGTGGGGGGGGNAGSSDAAGNGGGVGIYGQGANGLGGAGSSGNAYNGQGGSGGEDGGQGYNQTQGSSSFINKGGDFGGGGGAADNSGSENGEGGGGAIRIVWPGNVRQFPSTNVEQASTSLQKAAFSSTWNDVNYSSAISAGTTVTVDVLSENRFKLNGIRLYTGTDSQVQYTLNKTNSLANSFYVPGHGLTTGSEVRFTVGSGGTLPAFDGGTLSPSPSTNTNEDSTVKFFDILDNYVSGYLSGLSTVDLVTASHSGNSTRVFNTGTSNNISPIDYYDLQYTTNYVYYSGYGGYNIPNNNFYVGDLSSTQPLNILRGTPLENRNNIMVATDWTSNSTLPYYMWLRSSGYNANETWYGYFRDGFSFDGSASYIINQINGDDQNSYTATSGNVYRWAASFFRKNEQNNSHCIYINLMFFKYSGTNAWTTQNTTIRMQGAQSQGSYWYSFDQGDAHKDMLELGLVFFPSTAEADLNSSAEFVTFIRGMLENFDQNTSKPELTDDTVYQVNVLSNDRIALSTGGVTVDLTDGGVSPFIFKTENAIGVIDGVYSATSVTSDRINIQTDTKVEGARVDVDTTTVTDNVLQVADGASHTFIPGTEVVYDSNGQDVLGGLEDGGTYYVEVVDEQYFKLAATAEDATLGINPIEITANTGGNQIFSTDNIAGIIEASGTVDVESGENKITGTQTIFKRYFKVGDVVYIKNNNTTPGSLDSYTITSIADDAVMTVDRPINFTATDTKYFVSTKVYVRPDGFAIHRPFDGGVEIAAGTSPLSQIRRQTRKYFRYQSGKGIQTSLAINFNPPITIESLSSTVDNDIKTVLEAAVGDAVQAVSRDIGSGSTYKAVKTGLEQTYESSIKSNFVSSISKVEERVITLSSVSSYQTALDRANTHFTIINDILTLGETGANTEVLFPEPSTSGGALELASEIAIKDKLQANKTFIQEELKTYGDLVFPASGYNETNVTNRIGYMLDAIIYDGLYGSNNGGSGNDASYDFAKFLKSITSDEYRNIHIAMLDRFVNILSDILQGNAITKTTGNTETQVTSGDNVRATEAAEMVTLATMIRDTMRAGEPHLDGTGTAETITVTNTDANNYILDGMEDPDITLVRGVTYNFNVQAPGHPFWIKTATGIGTGDAYNTGVTNNGSDEAVVSITVDASAPNTLYYQCENHAAMVGTITVIDAPTRTEASMGWSDSSSQTAMDQVISSKTSIVNYSVVDTYIATVRTKYPHRLSEGLSIKIKDASDATYNGEYGIESIPDDFTFTYVLPSTPITSVPTGIIKYTLGPYTGASLRSGMFDDQNGFFFEFDGTNVNCVRRTSTAQLSGSVSVLKNSGQVTGNGFTQFSGQLDPGDKIVLRGQTYKVTEIESNNVLYIQPAYRGVSASGIIVTKTEDIRVPQNEWSLDRCDGTGPSGFNLDITKIQMTYSDYSWYGAGKIRFGFKNQDGHVIYVHEFVHNNRLDESYMRSGNVPGRYEIENGVAPQYAPTLFHWGTSVIMDGTFDDDKAYLFTAASESLTFTNGDSASVTTSGSSSLRGFYRRDRRQFDWYVRIPFSSADADKFYNGLPLYTASGQLNGETVSFTGYSGSTFYVYIFVQRSYNTPTVYPSVTSGTAVSLAVPATGSTDTDVNLGTDIIPLVSFRLAPSVDNNLSGNLGERDIINRMQLKLKEAGVILSHDCDVKLILNGDLSTVNWGSVPTPSLSQLIKHAAGDTITGGTELFTFRAAGGQTDASGKRGTNDTSLALTEIIDMGNSILGGDGTFPNGPDVLTVAVQVRDTNDIDAGNPFIASARINWAESQA